MNDLIGILDSGMGGISVLRRAMEILPGENFLYYGDNAHAPYGSRPLDEIVALSESAVNEVMKRDVKAIVMACNTMTAAYAEILRRTARIPVIGMEPAIKPASAVRRSGAVLVLATSATLHLEKFRRLCEIYGEGVLPVTGTGWVELVEEGRMDTPEADEKVARVLEPYRQTSVDCIVLGCTHYPFLRRKIENYFPDVPVFDGRDGTVAQLKRCLEREGTLNRNSRNGSVQLETSGTEETLEKMRKMMTIPL